MPLNRVFGVVETVGSTLMHLVTVLSDTAVMIATLPYYRLYHFNTIDPLNKISALASQSSRSHKLAKAISLWRARKLTELQFISISCTVLAAAVIGAFSWTTIEEAHWLTHGFWHASLILSILGILLSASQVTVLHLLGPLPSPSKPVRVQEAIDRYRPLLLSNVSDSRGNFGPKKKMVFTWQCPMMFMAYSVCAFLAGLTILVCTPLIRKDGKWNAGCNIAVMYLTISAIAGTTFVFCSFWIYHYVDLDFDANSDAEDDEEEGSLSASPPSGYGNMLVYSAQSGSLAADTHRRELNLGENRFPLVSKQKSISQSNST